VFVRLSVDAHLVEHTLGNGRRECAAVLQRGRLLSDRQIAPRPKTSCDSYNQSICCHPLGPCLGDNFRGRSTTGHRVVILGAGS